MIDLIQSITLALLCLYCFRNEMRLIQERTLQRIRNQALSETDRDLESNHNGR